MMERYACSLFIVLLSMAVHAQVRVVEMTCAPCPSAKLVEEAVAHYDAQARASGDATHLKIRLETNVPDEQVMSFLNQSLHCELRSVADGLKQGAPATTGSPQPFPVRVDTGDAAADDAAHEAAKQAWRIANPEAHRALIQQQGRQLPQ